MQPLQPVSGSDLQRFLSAPEELLQESVGLQLAVASFHQTPRSLLEILLKSPDEQVAEAASLHVNFAGEITDGWQQAVDEILQQRQLGQNDRLAVELLKIGPVPPCFLSEWVPSERLIQGLRNPQMPLRYRLQFLQRLSQEPSLEPRLQVAESPETPSAVLEQLAGDLELPVRLAVKFNPSSPPPLIELVEGQYAVASDWNTDSEQLAILGQSRWAWVRLAVAQNPSATAETLMQLAGDAVYKIQLAVAKNPETPPDVLAVLEEHQDKTIQAAVAEHGNATQEILHQLFPTQQKLLERRKNLPTSILERFFNEVATDKPLWKNYKWRYLFLDQPNTPTCILAELANVDLDALKNQTNFSLIFQTLEEGMTVQKWLQDETRFLADIAKHPQVSVEILQHLTQYPNPYVKLTVVRNSQTPEELKLSLLAELAVNADERIQVQVAENPHTPVHILEMIVQNEFYQTKLLQEIRRVLASEYPENSHSFKSTADYAMSDLKHDILYPAGISVDVESWMEIIESHNLLEVMVSNLTSLDTSGQLTALMIQLMPQWAEVLPNLSKNTLERVVRDLKDILGEINSSVKYTLRPVGVALVGNPNTPVTLREQLKNQLIRPSIPLHYQDSDRDVLLALAYNPQVPEVERMEYLQQLLDYVGKEIAMDSRTPLSVLEQLLERGEKEAIAKNPATPEYLLRRIANQPQPHDSIWRVIAENPNAPADLLLRFVLHPHESQIDSNVTMFDLVIANPNLPILERYRLLIGKEEAQEVANAHQLMAQRYDSPYALAQVLQNGDQKAKLTAAGSNKTPIQVLEQLTKDADETVRQVVLQNANLPLKNLLELARDKSFNVRSRLLYKSSYNKTPTPIQLLEILAQDESEQVRAKVAEHPDSPVEILTRLANDTSREVKSRLTANPNTPVTILTRLGLEENLVNQRNPNTPGIVLAQAVKSMSSKNLADFIKHPVKGSQMPAETLSQLAGHTDSSVRYRVASHPNTPATVLRQLARDSYVATVRAVASNANTFPETLEVLASHPDFTTRLEVVRNPNTPPRALAQIVLSTQNSGNTPNQTVDMLKSAFPGDHNDVLRSIAGNPRTPREVLEILARREFIGATPDPRSIIPPTTDDSIVRSLAYNPSLTPQLLGILVQDPCVEVRVCLVRHPNLTEALWLQLAEDTEISVREVAATINAPVSVLELLAQDEQVEVRIKVATNPNTPISVLQLLAGDENSSVRTAAASNSNLPETILTQLANDEKVEVRRAVAQNPNTPAPIRETLRDLIVQPTTRQTSSTLRGLNRLYNPSTDDLVSILAEYASSENAFVRFVTLLHPLTPHKVLTQAAQSASWLERYAVADNSGTPSVLRQQLAQDSNRIVRAAARV
ncbi:variant leucine-rich repeat-containing protein [Nostoc sp.]|uniref:variant leucine-rich repeat-containing protein n=1 Tax=Nostoc sp. TaxID=1180 RepID=UPI002FEF5AE7